MNRWLATSSAAALAAALAIAPTFGASLSKNAPPLSDGSSGSFNAQFNDGSCLVWFNIDNGNVECSDSGGYVKFTVPYEIVSWNGQTFHAFNFTDMTVQPTVHLTIYGSTPAMFLASQDIDFAGQFSFAAGAGAGGIAADQGDPKHNGGAGTSPAGVAGGGGGHGPGGQTQGEFCSEAFTAAGGGGGGNVHAGKAGQNGRWPVDAANPQYAKRGKGGAPEPQTTLYGGAGGGAGGGGYYGGNYYAYPGANGGGAVVLSTTGAITVESTGVMDTSGSNGVAPGGVAGSSGGGAGGDQWLYAQGAFSNSGLLTLQGGAGGTTQYTDSCRGGTEEGPDGGDGSGGRLRIKAATFDNRGLVDVSGGGRTGTSGALSVSAHVIREGRIKGLQGWQIEP